MILKNLRSLTRKIRRSILWITYYLSKELSLSDSFLNLKKSKNNRATKHSYCNPKERPYPIVPLVLNLNTETKSTNRWGKANLSHAGLNPDHVPYLWLNKPIHSNFCMTMTGRADIEGSKSDVDMNSWSPRISYPCGNFSDTSSWKSQRVRIDRPCVSICSPYWRLQSSESFSCQSTADFWSAWARLRTPALSFNRYAAPAKLPIWICRCTCILMVH